MIKSSKSFTLIELLVVIAIIGLLVSIVLVSLQDAEARARDGKRDAEAGEVGGTLRKTMEVYHSANGVYPFSTTSESDEGCCIEEDNTIKDAIRPYISSIPQDPLYNPTDPAGLDKYCYRYKTINNGEEYKIRVNYEKGEIKEVASWGGGGISYGGTPPDYALQFDGVNDYVFIGNDPSLVFGTGDLTAELWMKTESPLASNLIFKSDIANPNYGWGLSLGPGGWIEWYGWNDLEQWQAVVDQTPYIDGSWHHIVGVREGIPVRLYIDGILVDSQDSSALIDLIDGGDINIGSSFYIDEVTWFNFNGSIDEVRIYNRDLSPAEVTEHYNGIFSDETGLAGLWHFNEGSGNTTADDSGNGNNGSLAPACPDCPTWVAR